MRRIAAVLAAVALSSPVACDREPFRGPLRLLEVPTAAGALPKVGALSSGAETRPALLQSARWQVRLPARPLLTFGIGLAWAGEDEAPGWFRLTVRANDRVITERKLNPRAARGFRDVSEPLGGVGRSAELSFEIALTDRDGRPIAAPPGLLLGVSEPTIHDLDDYGRAKGVVLVSIDTLRRDHVGAYGYAKPTTPRLDALAREGLLCEDAVSTSSWTLPAHLSMLTGVDPAAHGGVDMHHGHNRRDPTLQALLKTAGFATRAITSHLYVSALYGFDTGFDHLDFHQERKATDVADRAIALLDRLGDRPFFLFLHFYDPHWHYDPPEGTRRLFATGYAGTLTGLWQDFKEKTRENTSAEELAHLLALYDGEIRYTDDEIGRILDHLKARGLDKSTLVLATSDHGEEFLEHGSWEHQKTLYEEVVRIPLILRGPGVTPRREKNPASLLDVAPTVLAWAGLAPRPEHQGQSLLSPLGDGETYGETDHTTDSTHKLFLRAGEGRWKLVLSLARGEPARAGERGKGRARAREGETQPARLAAGEIVSEEWYDLKTDPAELRNAPPRSQAAAAIRKRALDRWREGRARGQGAPAVSLTPEQRERLRALGYVGS
jgi:arylsulfatase A-like enzyme